MINMSIDVELLDEFKKELADRYTAEELCELLELDVWDVIEMFEEKIVELKFR
jgi:hypothetical protein